MNLAEDKVRTTISKAIRGCKKGWAQVAHELSDEVEQPISESMLHEFSRNRRLDRGTKKLFPSEWIPALAKITGSHELERYSLCDDCRRALAIGKLGAEVMAQKARPRKA